MDQIMNIARDLYRLLEMHVLLRLQHIGLRDVLDILILACVFFLLFKFIINRRAAKLALGLLFIVVIMFFSRYFDMKAMSFIFQNFTQAGIIAIIIMFQPELRSALEKIGNAPISNIKHMSSDTKSVSYISNAISVITETACDLSLEKTGALIVIERETKLGEHIKTGTIINAQLSSQILKNIFYNKAPLHDGAVILRNYRVFSAGCFLPLSLNEEIDENMGTRHRAAIGISEVSDAVVVVVSEETGKISIVHDGKLKQNYSYKSLQKELSNLLLPNTNEKDSKKSKLRRKFMKKGDNNE
jgi:diadenylate cyclase